MDMILAGKLYFSVSATLSDRFRVLSDALVAAAIAGQTSFNGITYQTTSENITGLIDAGSTGVNHGMLSMVFQNILFS